MLQVKASKAMSQEPLSEIRESLDSDFSLANTLALVVHNAIALDFGPGSTRACVASWSQAENEHKEFETRVREKG